MPEADAQLFAGSLVQADLWGRSSHGVRRLPWYARRLQSGAMRAVSEAQTLVDAAAVAGLDGRDGIGQVLATPGTREAMRRAELHGIGAVAVRNSNPFGTAMYHSLLGPQQGCINHQQLMREALT